MHDIDASPGLSSVAGDVQQPVKAARGCSEQQGSGSGSDVLPAAPAAIAPSAGTVCMKCRKEEAQLVARGHEPLCYPCLHEQLLSKVRKVVRLHALILPGDCLGLAFSGGPASATLLHFLAELHNPYTNRPMRGKVSFTMHIIHIDESATAAAGRSPAAKQAVAGMRDSVAAAARPYCGEGVEYHCVPLETVFEAGADGQQQAQLQELLEAVSDATGQEDLVRHLRSHLLLRTAAALGCGRLARGDCATRLATHIVAAAAKGCGYSLPGDVQLVDARHGDALPCSFLPLREVLARELGLLCNHWRLPQAFRPTKSPAADRAAAKSINALAGAFIAGMEAHNPGSVPNILKTLSKLDAFPWNDPAAAQASQAWNQQQQEQHRRQQVAAVLCPICWAPLADDELPGSSRGGGGGGSEHTSGGIGTAAAAAAAGCCLSCYRQILGGGSEAAGLADSQVVATLPPPVRQRMAALVAAGSQAAATGGADSGCDGIQPGSNSDSGMEQLRAHIAEFLLDA